MGYTTEFEGAISISPPLNESELSFLNDLANTRRMNRSKGPLYICQDNENGQSREPDIIDYNSPDASQPGLWLGWIAEDDGGSIIWDGVEKFYYSEEWMRYLIENLFSDQAIPYVVKHALKSEDTRLLDFTFDHVFNGIINAQGEDEEDSWQLVVENNKVKVLHI